MDDCYYIPLTVYSVSFTLISVQLTLLCYSESEFKCKICYHKINTCYPQKLLREVFSKRLRHCLTVGSIERRGNAEVLTAHQMISMQNVIKKKRSVVNSDEKKRNGDKSGIRTHELSN